MWQYIFAIVLIHEHREKYIAHTISWIAVSEFGIVEKLFVNNMMSYISLHVMNISCDDQCFV